MTNIGGDKRRRQGQIATIRILSASRLERFPTVNYASAPSTVHLPTDYIRITFNLSKTNKINRKHQS
jgi:hypothetical protein